MPKGPKFSSKTVDFLKKAGRQKNPSWLDRNREEYEELLHAPLENLARRLAHELRSLAPDYRFPLKGIGRMKRPSNWVAEHGGGLYKNWMTYAAARPRTSRFEHNPNLFFLINSEDEKDPVLVAGGLYMPSSKQTRAIREAIAKNASAFDALFADREFRRRFPGGFSDEKISSRPTRGFEPDHPRMSWLRLQAFFVWRPYTRREFSSPDFPALVTHDWKQMLRLNRLLEKAITGQLPSVARTPKASSKSALKKIEELEAIERKMDF